MPPAKFTEHGKNFAIVAGADLNGLGVLRSLGGAGIPIVALDTELAKETLWTRFGTKVRVRALSGQSFVEDLLALREKFSQKPVLFLTQEASVETASNSYEQLREAYHFSLPDRDTLRMLLDKLLFQAEAEKSGFPVPRALRLKADSSASPVGDLRFPCVLKPATKDPEYAKHFAKAYRVSSMIEVMTLWSDMRKVIDEAIVQEWIEGGDEDVYFCLQYRGSMPKARTSFVGRKLLQWPPLVGGTASCVPAPDVADELTALTDAFFESVGFVGLGSMEYKRDRRDKKFYMVEPTAGRTDYQEEIATLNGVNIPLAAYFGELGRDTPVPNKVVVPRAWRDPIATYRARETGAMDPLAVSPKGLKVCDAYFRLNDPGPLLYMKFEALTRRLARFGIKMARE